MEPDFHRQLGSTAVISTTRIFLEQVTRDAELRMIHDGLPHALQILKSAGPQVIVFGCTSAGSLGGIQHDAEIGNLIERETGARGVTVVASILDELRRVAPRAVTVFTPYEEELTRSVAGCVAEGGFRVIHSAGMLLRKNRDIGRVTPEEIAAFVKSRMSGQPDCLLLSCTNWRALEAIEFLQAGFGLPVITSNQACVAAVQRIMKKSGVRHPTPDVEQR
jgi:maleate isomerase